MQMVPFHGRATGAPNDERIPDLARNGLETIEAFHR
jgi:hypothetical protein